MNRVLPAFAFVSLLLAGCVVAPAHPVRVGPPPVVVAPAPAPVVVAPAPVVIAPAPPGVVYIAPTYAIPAPGYVWRYHPRFGWGWYHADHGWHRGWR